MANTIQSGSGSLFNLISRVLISPIYLLEAIWFTIVTPFLATEESHLHKIRHPEKDQRPYLRWKPSQASTAGLSSGALAGGHVHITLGCSAVTDGSVNDANSQASSCVLQEVRLVCDLTARHMGELPPNLCSRDVWLFIWLLPPIPTVEASLVLRLQHLP